MNKNILCIVVCVLAILLMTVLDSRGQGYTLRDAAFVGAAGFAAAGGGGGEWTGYHAAQYDGSVPNRIKIDSGLTGASDGTTGLCSVWVKFDDDGTASDILFNPGGDFALSRNSDGAGGNHIALFFWTGVAFTNSATAFTTASGWHHILIAWDSGTTANNKIYVDGADETPATLTKRNAVTIDYTLASWYVASKATAKFRMSELWFAPNQWLDISTSGNRLKFRSVGGKPVDLGATGTTPTGSAPLIYFRGDYTAPNVNSGTGGNFDVTGTPANSDSDKP